MWWFGGGGGDHRGFFGADLGEMALGWWWWWRRRGEVEGEFPGVVVFPRFLPHRWHFSLFTFKKPPPKTQNGEKS